MRLCVRFTLKWLCEKPVKVIIRKKATSDMHRQKWLEVL